MATSSELFIPSSPSQYSLRPLNNGMVTSETSMAMPDGTFLEVNGFDVTTRGPKKHSGWAPALFESGTTVPLRFTSNDITERIESQTQLNMADGTVIPILITNRAVYIVDSTEGYIRLNWMQSYTVASVSQTTTETTITITGDFTKHYIAMFDSVVFGGSDYPIVSVSATESLLTIVFTGIPTIVATNVIQIFKPFAANDQQYVDFTSSRNIIYFVDGTTKLIWKFDGTIETDTHRYLKAHIITGTDGTTRTVMGAKSVTAFGERIYFAGILEQDSESVESFYQNRIRWTEVLNHASSPAVNYQDLTRTTGKAVKILGMGSLIMVYFDDSIYYGRSSSLTSIPYIFTYIETAGVTAVGMKAVSTYFNGQVFQGYDNLYYISSSVEISEIGTAIAEELRSRSELGYMSNIIVDPERSRILLATSNVDAYEECLFCYNYRAKAWSLNDSIKFLGLTHQNNNDYLIYDEISESDTYDVSVLSNSMYKDFLTGDTVKHIFAFIDGYFMQYQEDLGLNQLVVGGIAVESENPCELITPDFDFDDPDSEKSALRVSLKLTEEPATTSRSESIYFQVDGSRDRGSTWKSLGRMRIAPGKDEDSLNFRLTGSTLRFRFRQGYSAENTSTNINSFTISEIILRIRGRNLEVQRSNAREG